MVSISVPYGESTLNTEIPSKYSVEILEPAYIPSVKSDLEGIRNAINHPIGTSGLREIATSGRTVAIVVNDITRPVPSEKMLTLIIDELRKGGIDEKKITIVVATGVHRPNTKEELREMLGDRIVSRVKVVNNIATDESSMTYISRTKRGVPVTINRTYAEADIKILTGQIRPHQIAGYSGGRKSVMPGIASDESVRLCHSFPIRSDLKGPMIGMFEGNYFHEEITEAARMAGVDFIVNVVLNKKRRVVKTVAGDLEKAWLEGVKTCQKMCKTEFSDCADVVITSPGGYPCDINLWQSQKALAPAELVLKNGGVIILVARCKNGTGNGVFSKSFQKISDPKEIIEKFVNEGYQVKGLSKAFMYARCLKKAKLIVVTEGISERILNSMFTEHSPSVEDALGQAREKLGRIRKIAVMPHALDLLPFKRS